MFRRIFLLSASIILMVSMASANQANQALGVGQQVTVDVQKAEDSGFIENVRRYCRFYELQECEDEFSIWDVPGVIHHMVTVDDPQEWYENKDESPKSVDLS